MASDSEQSPFHARTKLLLSTGQISAGIFDGLMELHLALRQSASQEANTVSTPFVRSKGRTTAGWSVKLVIPAINACLTLALEIWGEYFSNLSFYFQIYQNLSHDLTAITECM